MTDGLAARLGAVRERIARAAAGAGRRAGDVTLVGVSKRQPAEAVAALVAAGLAHCGESFVQEAREKIPRVAALLAAGALAPGLGVGARTPHLDVGARAPALGVGARAPTWHLVGRLQTNKAKQAAALFDVVEAVDRLELAHALDAQAAAAGRTLEVLLQVNVSGEAQKGGIAAEALLELAEAVARCAHLRLTGLMTVPAAAERPEDARPAFARLRELRDGLCRSAPGLTLPELSMGMSADFEIAIEEGATIVRVGTALFGARGGAA